MGLLKWRERDSNSAERWWFASIAIPLLAATIGPFANVLSIAALVNFWREDLRKDGQLLAQLFGIGIADPHWITAINATSLVSGYVGNFFLFCNFTNRIRYLVALPMTVILWFASAFLLIGGTIGMSVTCPPAEIIQSYTQAFWYAVISAVLYCLCSTLLLVNMLGFFLGHYGQHFVLTDSQRTLILQTFLFFIWLAGGAGVFQAIEDNWDFSNAVGFVFLTGISSYIAYWFPFVTFIIHMDFHPLKKNPLYFCDVTILTIGFGDLVPETAAGRGLIIPYAMGGIVFLGLVIASLSRFVGDLAQAKIVRARFDRDRIRTLTRSHDIEAAMESGMGYKPAPLKRIHTLSFSHTRSFPRVRIAKKERPVEKKRRLSLHVLRDEKDRFHAMRRLQEKNLRFKRYTTLISSSVSFVGLWLIGAVVFWRVERHTLSKINGFYDGFYFCYVSLLTIGYGDYTPFSSAGRPFFVVWSLFAVPTVTLLISAAGNTIVDAFDKGTNKVADFTLLPRDGIWREFINRHSWLRLRLENRAERKARKERLQSGFEVGPDPALDEATFVPQTLDQFVEEEENKPSIHEQARRLAHAIRHVADDLKHESHKRYGYEEWLEFSQLIRFTSDLAGEDDDEDEGQIGLINWDWIGEDSPMMAEQTEPEWLLDRLSESMVRYVKYHAPPDEKKEIVRRESLLADCLDDDDTPPNRRVLFEPDSPLRGRVRAQRDDSRSPGSIGEKENT